MADVSFLDWPFLEDHHRDTDLDPFRVWDRDHCHLTHRGVQEQRFLDLARRDHDATGVDDVLLAIHELVWA